MRYLKIKLKTLDSDEGFINLTSEPLKTFNNVEMLRDLRQLLLEYDCPTCYNIEKSRELLKGTAGIVYVEIE